ncbi:MAG: Rrf2 family transcriptional regulator [Acidimicrobiia bacterium]|nr:Rrf2 family transcriptional regulator [Acidimicrobiia bacterium]
MLRLSKKTDYALLAMRHLAANADRGAVSARELAETYDIPAELLAKVLQKLVRGKLLESQQGIRGGYALAKPATAMSVADVIQAVDGPLMVTACSDTDHSCDQYAKCNIRDPLWRIKDRIVATLAATSVAEMAMEMPVAPAPHPAGVIPMQMVKGS